jgi:hypothetical protein
VGRRDVAQVEGRILAHHDHVDIAAEVEDRKLADAEVIAPNVIRLDTENVLEIALTPGPALITPHVPVLVIWNGATSRQVTPDADDRLLLRAAAYTPPALAKRPELEGPVNDLFTTPFAIVVGTTSADPLMQTLCARAAQRFIAWWDERFHSTPRCFLDTRISEEDLRRYSLLLIGGPADNRIAAMLADRIPLKVAANAITLRHQ